MTSLSDVDIEGMTSRELRSYIVEVAGDSAYERRKATETIRQLSAGLKLLGKIKASRNGSMSKDIPGEEEWRSLSIKDAKGKAKWYLKNCPERGTLDYNLFKRLAKGFGLVGNEFYYWVRKLK